MFFLPKIADTSDFSYICNPALSCVTLIVFAHASYYRPLPRGYTGKTDTLNLLIDLLEASASASPMPQPQPEGHDRRKVVRYRGLTVGVCTPGDTEDEVRENRDFFEQHACDVGVTAAVRGAAPTG